jgi:integrase
MPAAMGVKVKFHKAAWWVFIHHAGRRRAKKIGDRETADAVARRIRERLALGDLSLLSSEPAPTFDKYAENWLSTGEASRKASTHRFYAFNLAVHINPILGAKPVAAIKRADCRELLAACREKGLKIASMRGVNRTLSAVLSEAVEDALLPANPAFRMGKYLRDADEAPVEIHPFTAEEAHRFLTTVQQRAPHWYAFFLCGLRTGMRLGELLALEWRDLDFEARIIHVRRAWVSGRLTSPKNKQRRKIDMSLKLAEELRRLRTDRKKAALKAGRPMNELVFLMPDLVRIADHERVRIEGGRVDGDNLRRRVFQKLLRAAKVPDVRLHDLRHTFASLLIQNGESLAYVRDQLGHSSIQVTVDIYGHMVPGANRAAVDKLDAVPTPSCENGADAAVGNQSQT